MGANRSTHETIKTHTFFMKSLNVNVLNSISENATTTHGSQLTIETLPLVCYRQFYCCWLRSSSSRPQRDPEIESLSSPSTSGARVASSADDLKTAQQEFSIFPEAFAMNSFRVGWHYVYLFVCLAGWLAIFTPLRDRSTHAYLRLLR